MANGVAFTHAYCQSPICTPSRASFLTGMYASTVHGCMNGNSHWADAAPLVTKLLADVGYDCGLAGKLHLSAAQDRIEPRPDDGYRVFEWSHGSCHVDHPGDCWDAWLKAQGHSLAELRRNPAEMPVKLHQTTWCTDRAIAFIEDGDREAGQPWLFSLNPFDPHPPFDCPKPYVDRYDREAMPGPYFEPGDLEAQVKLAGVDFQTEARDPESFNARGLQANYFGMVELIDANVGRLMDALERSGQLDNTVVIFTSDHGETLGDHGLLMKGLRFYEGLVRVPLIVSWPGQFAAGIRRDALVELTDLAPTLLALAGEQPHDRMQGRSLLPLLTDAQAADEHRPFVRCEYYHALEPKGVGDGTMLRDRRYKLCVYHGHPIGELFDLQEDPWEHHNLWDSPEHQAIKCRLMQQSFDALAQAVDRGPAQVAYY